METSRRTFFRAGAAAVLARRSIRAQTEPGRVHSSFDPWIEILPANLRHNVAEIRKRVGSRPILAVIKNNGYGLGIVQVARILEDLPEISGFAVIKAGEAHSLRDAGIRKPILLMGPFDDSDLQDAVAREIRPMVYTPIGNALESIAGRLQRRIPIHVCVDTGIGRVGVPLRDAAPLIRDLAGRGSVQIEGIMMTFTEDADFDRVQLSRFRSLCDSLQSEGIILGRRHAASSFGLFQHPDAFLDQVRPGMAIFGIYSEAAFRKLGILDLRPALSLKARVIYVKRLIKGESAGYNRAYVAPGDVWLATLPVGHADGLPRAAAKGGRVRIGGAVYPLVASVSASHCIAEVGASPSVNIGDPVCFYDDSEGMRPEDLSAVTGASVYDLTMHLNALLPKRVV